MEEEKTFHVTFVLKNGLGGTATHARGTSQAEVMKRFIDECDGDNPIMTITAVEAVLYSKGNKFYDK